jgi:hypothetical protein
MNKLSIRNTGSCFTQSNIYDKVGYMVLCRLVLISAFLLIRKGKYSLRLKSSLDCMSVDRVFLLILSGIHHIILGRLHSLGFHYLAFVQ